MCRCFDLFRVVFFTCKFSPFLDLAGTPEKFTIKCIFGGKFEANHKNYVEGHVRYVDHCDVDEISLIEILSMFKECGELSENVELFYKLPSSKMEESLFPMACDADVMNMCNYLDSCRVMYVYSLNSQMSEESQNYVPAEWLDFNFLGDPNLAKHDNEETEQLLELEGILVDFSDPHDEDGVLDNVIEVDHYKEGDDNLSFHDDSSNVDSIDEDVTAVKKVRSNLKKNDDPDQNKPVNQTPLIFSDEGDVLEGEAEGEAKEEGGGETGERGLVCYLI